ncbi:MAG: hypothetical protein GKR89_17485 [Candidatus Latescibacteria bacterium]|nr:hypothetical protein [Candidatus Latescibacterota bacterium]
MQLHITRHGQTDVNSDHPPGDPHLTSLGHRQAKLLGRALKEHGFAGTIYSSPYLRTVETAQGIAAVTGAKVLLAAEMREYVIRENQMDDFTGATQEALVAAYPPLQPTENFPYPWWTDTIETDADIEARVAPLIDRVAGGQDDALLVGHGASVQGVHRYILRRRAPDQLDHGGICWNCCLSSFALGPDFKTLRLMDVAHLPDEAITSNTRPRAEVLAEGI